jgi:hypothetical protein
MINYKFCDCCNNWIQESITCDCCGLETHWKADNFYGYIEVYFPYGHDLDSEDESTHFCSNRCLILYTQQAPEPPKFE